MGANKDDKHNRDIFDDDDGSDTTDDGSGTNDPKMWRDSHAIINFIMPTTTDPKAWFVFLLDVVYPELRMIRGDIRNMHEWLGSQGEDEVLEQNIQDATETLKAIRKCAKHIESSFGIKVQDNFDDDDNDGSGDSGVAV